MARFGVGQSARRKEDDALLKGRGRFQDDIALAGEVHACFVRSPHAHADIAAVETAGAAAAPGVLAVYTGADVAADGLGTLPCVADAFIELKRPDGSPACYPPNPMLAHERVRHVGEAVAMVVAESQAAARDAADLVSVEYAALPAVVDAAEAREPGATRIWPEAPGNLSCVLRYASATGASTRRRSRTRRGHGRVERRSCRGWRRWPSRRLWWRVSTTRSCRRRSCWRTRFRTGGWSRSTAAGGARLSWRLARSRGRWAPSSATFAGQGPPKYRAGNIHASCYFCDNELYDGGSGTGAVHWQRRHESRSGASSNRPETCISWCLLRCSWEESPSRRITPS